MNESENLGQDSMVGDRTWDALLSKEPGACLCSSELCQGEASRSQLLSQQTTQDTQNQPGLGLR